MSAASDDQRSDDGDDGDDDEEDEEDQLTAEARMYLTPEDWDELEQSIGPSPTHEEIDEYNGRIKERMEWRKRQTARTTEVAEYADEEASDATPEGKDAAMGDVDEDAEMRGAEDEEQEQEQEEGAVDDPETRLQNMRRAFGDMEQELKRLRTQVKDLKQENARLTTAFDVATRRIAQAPASGLSRDHARPEVLLHQVFDVPQGQRIEDIPAPHRFTAAGSFPHAISTSLKTGFKEYQVSRSRKVTIKFRLAKVGDLSPANEHDVCPGGLLGFKIQVVYADRPEVPVLVTDFTRLVFDNIISQPESTIKNVVNGELFFSFNFCAASRDTSPPNALFMIKVWPADEAVQKEHPLLTQFTPAFLVRSKTTKLGAT